MLQCAETGDSSNKLYIQKYQLIENVTILILSFSPSIGLLSSLGKVAHHKGQWEACIRTS